MQQTSESILYLTSEAEMYSIPESIPPKLKGRSHKVDTTVINQPTEDDLITEGITISIW